MEPELQRRLMKYSLVGIGVFLLISMVIAVVQNIDERNGYYVETNIRGLEYFSMNYSREYVEVNWRSRCGNCDTSQPILVSGKPEIVGDKVILHDRSFPNKINGELKILPGQAFAYDFNPPDSEPITLNFEREEEPRPWRRILIHLGFPPSAIP
ncbi:MAG: hypothetical protein KF836_12170 [Fimbriimonadaceae bacterium]|nr:hypothetical protein [Fimbriimonadaceae bacterium]